MFIVKFTKFKLRHKYVCIHNYSILLFSLHTVSNSAAILLIRSSIISKPKNYHDLPPIKMADE